MIFNGRSLHELNNADFEILVQNWIPEASNLEYKEIACGGKEPIPNPSLKGGENGCSSPLPFREGAGG
jgi:hypothetical protein